MVKDIDFKAEFLNVRGINEDVKHKGIYDWAKKQFDIVMLQECYCCKILKQSGLTNGNGLECFHMEANIVKGQ